MTGAYLAITMTGAYLAITMTGAYLAITLTGAYLAITRTGAYLAITMTGAMEWGQQCISQGTKIIHINILFLKTNIIKSLAFLKESSNMYITHK